MHLFYSLGIRVYFLAILSASVLNKKARQWISGRKKILQKIADQVKPNENILWFHISSLGEFEQGRPVIEAIRKKYDGYKVLITFFSPSGYEIRKNYTGADYVFYLPADTMHNAKRFVEIIKPAKVFFVKYDFWYNYLKVLDRKNIPVYLISGIFRKDQIFFRWYGKWYKKVLGFFTFFFVQNQESLELLNAAGFSNAMVSGDTRFDRVVEIAGQALHIELVDNFCVGDKQVVVCGSTWEKDEYLLLKYINESDDSIKFVIAPHEIHESHIQKIVSGLDKSWVRFSQAMKQQMSEKKVLIIDNIGMLSSLYKYGDVAYIGGGFGVGIHNILEAATFGLPVVFGPNYKKFREAVDLIGLKGAFSINDYSELTSVLSFLLNDKREKGRAGETAKNYVSVNKGSSLIILNKVFGKY